MSEKRCTKCGITKPLEEFNRRSASSDGRESWCRVCKSEYSRERYQRPEVKARDLERLQRNRQDPNFIAREREYRQSEKGRAVLRKSARKYRANPNNKPKLQARLAVRDAVAAGNLPRVTTLDCVCCGAQAQHYHHYLGYAWENRFDVKPVCVPCHYRVDRGGEC